MFAALGVRGEKACGRLLHSYCRRSRFDRNSCRYYSAVLDEEKFLLAKRLLRQNKVYQRRRATFRERRVVNEYREKIVLYKNEEKYGLALKTYNELRENGVVPDVETYTTMLWICKR